jgi:hypothetical protein
MTRFALLALVLLTIGCNKKPKVGDKCENGLRACIDGTSGLYCANGAFQADTCRGAKGCAEEKGIATCDITGNNDGDPCPAALDGFSVCRADRKTRAMCKGGKYVVETCRGEDGCTTEQVGMARCDKGNPEPGEACTSDPRLQYCSGDKKSMLTCKDGKYVVRQKCPGPHACRPGTGGAVICDPNGEFAAGDDCFFISAMCAGRSLLNCKDGKFAVAKDCPGEGGCSGVMCDDGFAAEGEPCVVGRHVCNLDKKSLLECKLAKGKTVEDIDAAPTWSVAKKCKGECTAKDGKLNCD